MKTIGLIGGVTWQSTLDYYRIINKEVARRLGGQHSAQIVISSLDFHQVFAAQNAQKPEVVASILKENLQKLERAGVDFFAIAANTLHMHAAELRATTQLPMVHIIDETAKVAKARGLKKLCLLGTGFTMRSSFFVDHMANLGIQTIVPADDAKEVIHRSIFEELIYRKINPETKKKYLEIVESARSQRCDGIILGCTEIPLILTSKDTDMPLLDTAEIHAHALVREAI